MLKAIGAVMILTGCAGTGLWYRSWFLGRIRALRQLAAILELLCSEIRYGRATLPECCGHAASRLPEEYRGAFRRIAERMRENTGESFAAVFAGETGKALDSLPLKEADRQEFLRFATQGSFADGQMQLRVIEQSREQLLKTVAVLESESADKCRMAIGLGAMSGLMIILVLC